MTKAGDELQQSATRIFGEEIQPGLTFDRERLILRTAALLNARASFERAVGRGPISPAEDRRQWEARVQRLGFELFVQADKLFPALIGKAAFETHFPGETIGSSPAAKRQALTRRLMVYRGLLSEPSWGGVLRAISNEIITMDGGDEPTVLAPERRNRGQARQPTLVAWMRLRALCWHAHLTWKGLDTSVRQNAVASAYKTAWDTMRKWRGACEAVFGEEHVARHLKNAASEWYWYGEYSGDDWRAALEADGTDYYENWREQRSGKKTG